MDPLGDSVSTYPVQRGWECTMELYPIGQFGFIDIPDPHCGNGSVWTQTRTWSEGPHPLLTLPASTSSNSCSHGLRVHLWVHLISASKCFSILTRSLPPCVFLSSLDLHLQVHFKTCSIMASQCISQCTQSCSPIASANSINHGLQVQLWVYFIPASKCISQRFHSRLQTNSCMSHGGSTDILRYRRRTEQRGVHIWLTPWLIYIMSFSSHLDSRNCVNSHGLVVSYLLTFLNIYRDTKIMHTILWGSESCDCNKHNYDGRIQGGLGASRST
jgi:hypothetical protein